MMRSLTPNRQRQQLVLIVGIISVYPLLLAIQQSGRVLDVSTATIALEIILQQAREALPLKEDEPDADCPFRNSPIYRKVYVYPSYGEDNFAGDILSDSGHNSSTLQAWPWLELERISWSNQTAHYDIDSEHVQYTTELLVRELMMNSKSCLCTDDPEEATLFYVPYLPSVEHHRASNREKDMSPSPYGRAILDILDRNDYSGWEDLFGLTSKYWKRRNGSDHILVFSEPLHGLYHPTSRRGSFHYIHTQKQLAPPIVISVELSKTFVEMNPKCAAKNILMPYPNTDGRWFNGAFEKEAAHQIATTNVTAQDSLAALPSERELAKAGSGAARPAAMFYHAGVKGVCTPLRRALKWDYRLCSKSFSILHEKITKVYRHGMHVSTFCPAPAGDSPSAKRNFDACIAGCIPVVLSYDFVWPFSKDFDPTYTLDPADFSLEFPASDFLEQRLNETTCEAINSSRPSLESRLRALTAQEISWLRKGVGKAGELYSWYKRRPDLPENLLRDRVLPDGGAAFALVDALAKRASGARWPACEEELKLPRKPDPKSFKC